MAENIEETDIFTKQGHFKDEVILEFEDGKSLFVSQAFLVLASPVFEAVFSGDYKEKQEGKVKLAGKKYEDVLESLLCLYPRTEKSVDESNVLQVAPLADEYRVLSLNKSCQEIMMKWLKRLCEDEKRLKCWPPSVRHLPTSLTIIALAAQLNYTTVRDCACEVLADYPFEYYETYKTDVTSCTFVSNCEAKSCPELFSILLLVWKYEIVCNRLARCERKFTERKEFSGSECGQMIKTYTPNCGCHIIT